MNTTNSSDPLDQKIDTLLSNQALKPSGDFTQRVLAATEELPITQREARQVSPTTRILRFALPLAAVIAFALTLAQILPEARTGTLITQPTELNTADVQEILLLQEGLSKLAQNDAESLDSNGLLDALDALYLEIES